MVAYSQDPATSLAANCMRKPDIGIKNNLDFGFLEGWESGVNHSAAYSLQVHRIATRRNSALLMGVHSLWIPSSGGLLAIAPPPV